MRFIFSSLQSCYDDRWIGESFESNFAAGSFHTKKLCSRLYSIELLFTKTTNSLFEPPFGELGVTYTLLL